MEWSKQKPNTQNRYTCSLWKQKTKMCIKQQQQKIYSNSNPKPKLIQINGQTNALWFKVTTPKNDCTTSTTQRYINGRRFIISWCAPKVKKMCTSWYARHTHMSLEMLLSISTRLTSSRIGHIFTDDLLLSGKTSLACVFTAQFSVFWK